MTLNKKSVLFVCTHNSARSQMAEGLLREYFGHRFDVFSAGMEATEVRPLAIEAMKEIGVDLSSHSSKTVADLGNREFDYVITVCDNAKERCPYIPIRNQKLHWSFEDPAAVVGTKAEKLAAFREIRDQIRERIDATFGKE